MHQAFGPLAIFGFALGILGYIVQSRLPPPKPKVIGIDLGTTFSCVGVYNAVYGNVTVLETDGERVIPSVVAFVGDNILVGYHAARQAEKNPTQTIYDAKRFIGKVFRKNAIDNFDRITRRYPFQMYLDDRGNPSFVLKGNESNKVIYKSPDDIGALVLSTLRRTAEKKLKTKITKAVVSVPAEFTEDQRNATILAGKKAGLDILRVINEPTAAAMAYGLHKRSGSHIIVVIDFGGGTCDVSLLNVQGGMFVTMAMAGNNRLGGQDVNENILNFLTEKLAEKGCVLVGAEDIQHLRDEVERAKLTLSSKNLATIEVLVSNRTSCQLENSEKLMVIDRKQFEYLNRHLFERILLPIRRVLKEAEVMVGDVDEVVLVGGSTRILKVRQLVAEFFGKRPNVSIDPDVAVVTGVAVQAGILGGAWPLQVSAIEIHRKDIKKIDVNNE